VQAGVRELTAWRTAAAWGARHWAGTQH
jgi:hypothetical protein